MALPATCTSHPGSASLSSTSCTIIPAYSVHVNSGERLLRYLDFTALFEVVDGLSLKFSHFHHPTILGSLPKQLKLNTGDTCAYKIVHLWSVRRFRFFVGVETTEDVEASSKTREVGIYNRVPGRRKRYRRTDQMQLSYTRGFHRFISTYPLPKFIPMP